MVCAPCLLPLLGGAALTGGTVQAQKESEREYRWMYILLILSGLGMIGYWWWLRRRAASGQPSCSTCQWS